VYSSIDVLTYKIITIKYLDPNKKVNYSIKNKKETYLTTRRRRDDVVAVHKRRHRLTSLGLYFVHCSLLFIVHLLSFTVCCLSSMSAS
jgi:hypothetical protein